VLLVIDPSNSGIGCSDGARGGCIPVVPRLAPVPSGGARPWM